MQDLDDVVVAYWEHYALLRLYADPSSAAAGTVHAAKVEPVDLTTCEWADRAVNAAMRGGGVDAVRTLAALAESAPSDRALCWLGAGPLEDLIRWHGIVLMDELDEALDREPRLREALSCVRLGHEHLSADTRLRDVFDPQRDEKGRLPWDPPHPPEGPAGTAIAGQN